MTPPKDHQREIPPELSGNCAMSLAFRTDPGWKHVAGSHRGWGDENFHMPPKIYQPAPVNLCDETAGCLTVPIVNEDGSEGFIRFILMSPDFYQVVAASLGQPVLSNAERAAMVKDIRF